MVTARVAKLALAAASAVLLIGFLATSPTRSSPDILRILLISDIHDDEEQLGALRAWLVSHRMLSRVDMVLCPGGPSRPSP